MEKEIIKWNQSNLEVKIKLTEEDYKKLEEKALKEAAKDIQVPGYRPWKAPLDIVKEHINDQYLKGYILESAINDSIKELAKEYQLIGQIYDVNQKEENWNIIITYKVDVYPEVEVKNENYNSVEPTLPNEEVTEEEVNNAVENLKKQFAEYKDVDKVDTEKTYVKLDLEYLDENGNKVGDGKVFLAKEDFEEFPILKETFADKEVWFEAEFDYDEEKLPQLLQYFKKDKDQLNIKKVKAKITEIKEPVIPELTVENLKKWFGKTYEKVEDFLEEVKQTLKVEKRRIELGKFVEDLLSKIKDSFEVVIPSTLVEQEVKQRIENLAKRYGGKDKFEQMLRSMKPEEVKKFYEDITNAAKESVKNFLILMKYAELKKILDKVDFKKDMDFEEKLLSLFKKERD
jgi:trigger factor